MLITKLYNDLTYWKKSTYENLRTYDCSDNEAFYENDSSSELSLPDSFFSDDDDNLINSPDSTKSAQKSDHSEDEEDDNKSNSSLIIRRRKVKRGKRTRGASQFILDEADDDESMDDDELQPNSDDHSLHNFIDDEDKEEYNEDVHINYMRSVADVVNGQGKYKLKYDFDPTIEVYSQYPSTQEIEEDEYDENDSFICEEIIYSNTQPAPVNIASPRRLRSRKPKVLPGFKRKESTPIAEKPKKRYKRVFIESP